MPRSLAVPSLTEQLRKERGLQQVSLHRCRLPLSTAPHYIQCPGVRKTASGLLEASNLPAAPVASKQFRAKPLLDWSVPDVCDWLDSLYMSEYKVWTGRTRG